MTNSKNDYFDGQETEMDPPLSGLAGKSSYPSHAVPLGTYIRANRYNKTGIVIDAHYEYTHLNEEEQKIVIYTLLLRPLGYGRDNGEFIIVEESEYETICYLMMKPVKIKQILKNLDQGDSL